MTNEMASKHNWSKESNGTGWAILTMDGRLLTDWREDGKKIYELDAYGGTVGTFVMGVNCSRVVRRRVTTVVETYTVEA